MRATEVRSPSTPRSSASARSTTSRTAVTGGSKSPLTASSLTLGDGGGGRDPHTMVGPEVDDPLQGLAGLGVVEPVVAATGFVPLGGGGHHRGGHGQQR